jgi:sec-independent protein translocase protein TatB
MFDIGWSEILVIAAVAIVVVGPKELPKMLRTFGKTMGQVRRTANDFKRQFDQALREAERQADLGDTKKELQSIARMDPLKDAKKDFDATMKKATGVTGAAGAAAAAKANGAAPVASPAPPPVPASAAAEPAAAEPVKIGAAAGVERGSDAA